MPPHSADTPAKKQSKWSPEEDALIIELRGSGMKWEDISKRLPGRSAISCRLHYQNYLERRSEWDEDRKNKLARLYERFKPEMWAKVAEEMQVPWRAAEAMHWQLGESDMARRAGVVPFSLTAATLEAPHHYRTSPSHAHHHSQSYGGTSGARYNRVSSGTPTPGGLYTIPSGRTPARRESTTMPPQMTASEADDMMYYTYDGPGLPPIQTGSHGQVAGMLPGVAELTTGMSAYSTPAYSMSIPSASPVHSQSTSPIPPLLPPGMGYPSYEPAGAKRRASPEQGYREARRRGYDAAYYYYGEAGESSTSRY